MSFDVKAAVAAAKQTSSEDMTKAVKGGGYEVPAAGFVRLRFVGYVEIGEHMRKAGQGKPDKKQNQVQMTFELSGPKHEPRVLDDGTVIPHRITITENKSLNEKAHFFKLFTMMNWEGKATLMAELLGNEFIGNIVHNVVGENTYANLRDDNGYTIRKPFVPDAESGEDRRVSVAPAVTPLKVFLWDHATKEMWDSLFIDGMYEEQKDDKGNVTKAAKSKNVLQEKIKSALNWPTSRMCLLLSGGDALNLGAAENPKAEAEKAADAPAAEAAGTGAGADPLGDIPV